ncbi:MAG: IS66 family transposase [Patescibacteria group bacterium]
MKIPPHLANLSKRDIIRYTLSLESRIEELEKRLLAYDNAHTPPSKQQRKDHYPKPEGSSRKRGAPKGHEGTTRPTPEPTETKTLNLELCPDCKFPLGKVTRLERRVIEELPEPQPLRVIEFLIPHYECKKCNKEVIPVHSELPKTGRLGNNLQSQIVLAKYEDRLPHRKVASMLNRQYNLDLSPATIVDVQKRVADHLQPEYEKIKTEVKNSTRLHADETGAKLDGDKHWLWVFLSKLYVLFCFSKKREAKVIEDILGMDYLGILTVDGLKAYPKIVNFIQRCWAHLLREAKFLAQKHEGQAQKLYKFLCELFRMIKAKIITYEKAIQQMKLEIGFTKGCQELRKFAGLLENGLEQWFTCLLYPDVEPTNNKAERQLREFVIQRKIYSTFRSEEGLRITETILSVLATWKLQGKNPLQMLRLNLSS